MEMCPKEKVEQKEMKTIPYPHTQEVSCMLWQAQGLI